MSETITSVETVVELENHIFIHPPDKKGTAASHCFNCGKTLEQHRWKSPAPWQMNDKESGRQNHS